MTQLTWEPF